MKQTPSWELSSFLTNKDISDSFERKLLGGNSDPHPHSHSHTHIHTHIHTPIHTYTHTHTLTGIYTPHNYTHQHTQALTQVTKHPFYSAYLFITKTLKFAHNCPTSLLDLAPTRTCMHIKNKSIQLASLSKEGQTWPIFLPLTSP